MEKTKENIWKEVLESLEFKFQEEVDVDPNHVEIAHPIRKADFKSYKYLLYKKIEDGYLLEAKLYINFNTGEVTSFLINGWQMFETFQRENKKEFRLVKLKYILESK